MDLRNLPRGEGWFGSCLGCSIAQKTAVILRVAALVSIDRGSGQILALCLDIECMVSTT